ncbi:hypothetical protein [Pseudoalteromonas sp. R3]|uniref:hypothetical protein n=1 Tax=Pseudoalteromonas sp. R3 TaxID=1709477 RepID=UPI0009E76E8F|nr:hypothetical protein [Pseudoalteromonas sp. R3]AZZ98746.1 hypothetical protein ELR70_17570 [Pseudoalteromonas sp. R3]
MNTVSFAAPYQVNYSPATLSFKQADASGTGDMLRFTAPYKVSVSPVTIRFEGATDPDTPKEGGVYVSTGWELPKSTRVERSAPWSLLDVALIRVKQSWVVSCSDGAAYGSRWGADTAPLCREVLLISEYPNSSLQYFDLLGNAQESVGINAMWRWGSAAQLGTRYRICWSSPVNQGVALSASWSAHPPILATRTTIAYAPRVAEYICVRTAHPIPGFAELKFNGLYQPSHTLEFGIPDKTCRWGLPGGLVRSDDDVPTLDRKIPIEPQLQRAYIMQPTITCKRLSDDTDILITSFSHSLERGQFAATGSIRFCSRIDMERALGQELLVTINGYEYVVICEQPSTSSKFGSVSFSASIRGRFAMLATPYARETNYTNPTTKTMAGIMSDALTNTSWTLDNQMIDYPIPKGAYSYRGLTPASALLRIAQSVGGILDFDDVSKTVSVIPEWPVAPWDTDSAVCDVILNDSLILEHNTRQTVSPEHTAVFVRGEQQGVACKIKRAGTLGDQYAYDVVDSLITDNQAARQRGTCELARSGNKKISEIRTKLTATLPPIRPGMLIGIRYSDSLYKATCDSASVSVSINAQGAVTVNQSIRLVSNV